MFHCHHLNLLMGRRRAAFAISFAYHHFSLLHHMTDRSAVPPADGQLPHHFVGDKPTFLALSGATQTGPNTFWTKSALQYARNSGNLAWLKSYMPTLRASAAFCFVRAQPLIQHPSIHLLTEQQRP